MPTFTKSVPRNHSARARTPSVAVAPWEADEFLFSALPVHRAAPPQRWNQLSVRQCFRVGAADSFRNRARAVVPASWPAQEQQAAAGTYAPQVSWREPCNDLVCVGGKLPHLAEPAVATLLGRLGLMPGCSGLGVNASLGMFKSWGEFSPTPHRAQTLASHLFRLASHTDLDARNNR